MRDFNYLHKWVKKEIGFLNMLNDCVLEQVVKELTREQVIYYCEFNIVC